MCVQISSGQFFNYSSCSSLKQQHPSLNTAISDLSKGHAMKQLPTFELSGVPLTMVQFFPRGGFKSPPAFAFAVTSRK